tara:strand:- start:1424 stop:2584 length:1161 start_codon:yes stop_codon:yes gene_type:complete
VNIDKLTSKFLDNISEPSKLSQASFDLSAGVPDEDSLPSDLLGQSTKLILQDYPKESLIYAGTKGYLELREWIINNFQSTNNQNYSSDNVSLVSGSAHGLDNIARTFINSDDIVLVNAPTYPGALRTFRACGAQIVDVSLNGSLDLNKMSTIISELNDKQKRIKLFYIVSSNNNPTGMSLDDSIKSELVDLCSKNNILIVDDRAYEEIYFSSTFQPSLSAVAPSENIIEIGTFSKTIATGVRVAWIVASDSIINKLDTMRFDNGGSNLMQRVIHHFVSSKNYVLHLNKIRDIYKEKRDISANALEKYCENKIEFAIPNGGFYHWLKINNGVENDVLRKRALQKGVGINTGNIYYVNGDDKQHVRLVFSKLNLSDLENSIQIFSTCF